MNRASLPVVSPSSPAVGDPAPLLPGLGSGPLSPLCLSGISAPCRTPTPCTCTWGLGSLPHGSPTHRRSARMQRACAALWLGESREVCVESAVPCGSLWACKELVALAQGSWGGHGVPGIPKGMLQMPQEGHAGRVGSPATCPLLQGERLCPESERRGRLRGGAQQSSGGAEGGRPRGPARGAAEAAPARDHHGG